MNNDKAFAICTVTLIAAVLSVLTASVMSGFASLPTPLAFVEHLFFTVGFRAAYHSLEGPGWAFPPARSEEPAGSMEIPATGRAAGATS